MIQEIDSFFVTLHLVSVALSEALKLIENATEKESRSDLSNDELRWCRGNGDWHKLAATNRVWE